MSEQTFEQWLESQGISADAPGVNLARRAWRARGGESQFLQEDGLYSPAQLFALRQEFTPEDLSIWEEAPSDRDMVRNFLSSCYWKMRPASELDDPKQPLEAVCGKLAAVLALLLEERGLLEQDNFQGRESVSHAVSAALEAGRAQRFFSNGEHADQVLKALHYSPPAGRRPKMG